jgi:hypothetical protein
MRGLAFIVAALLTVAAQASPLGLIYFVFFDGPGLSGMSGQTPNVLGLPDDDGLRLTNYLSVKYRLGERWALDFQARVQWVLNNAQDVGDFQALRWQSPRIGVSGKLLSGNDWTLTGAINTDFPYFFPAPIGGGFVAERRTTLLNPGLFAKFSYQPKGSRWSLFSLVMPRFFVYRDRNAAEPQLLRAGYSPGLKPELTLSFSPSVNYDLGKRFGVRLGTELTYRKLVLSSWNPFRGSLNGSDIQSKAWRLAPVPIQMGVTYEPSDTLNVSLFFQGFPIAAQRERRDGSRASFAETTSVGMWISGVLL